MPVITTYVCDVTGKTSPVQSDFATVTINASYKELPTSLYVTTHKVEKLVHKEVLAKLGLTLPTPRKDAEDAAVAEIMSFQGQLANLLRPMIEEIAQEVADNQ